MGYSTKDWGPLAWVTVHWVAEALDDADIAVDGTDFWTVLPHILPCEHCQISSLGFVRYFKHRSDIVNHRHMAFMVHMLVNEKLRRQDLRIMNHSDVGRKWRHYAPASWRQVSPRQWKSARKHVVDFLSFVFAYRHDGTRRQMADKLRLLKAVAHLSQEQSLLKVYRAMRQGFERSDSLKRILEMFYRFIWKHAKGSNAKGVNALLRVFND